MFESNLLSQINVNTPIPTFVETHLITSLNNTMHDAFVFAHAMIADRNEGATLLASLLPYSSELFYGLWGMLEWQMLKHVDSPFAEYLFGLKRNQVQIDSATTRAFPSPVYRDATVPMTFRPLSSRSRIAIWISLILYPWLKRLLRLKYEKLTGGSPDAIVERQSLERRYGTIAKLWHNAVIRLYPLLHILCEGSSYVFQLGYLLERTPFLSAWQYFHQIAAKRVTGRDQISIQSNPSARKVMILSQLILTLMMFGFRVLEWRRGATNTNEPVDPEGHGTRIVQRPDIEREYSAKHEGLPAAGICPVCSVRISNPAVNTASGIVCCYPCLQSHVESEGLCPVTRKHTNMQNIRRLFEA